MLFEGAVGVAKYKGVVVEAVTVVVTLRVKGLN